MDIGTGIAIAGVWIFAALFGALRYTSGLGAWVAIVTALLVTVLLTR